MVKLGIILICGAVLALACFIADALYKLGEVIWNYLSTLTFEDRYEEVE